MSDSPFVGKWSYTSFVSDPTQFLDEVDEALGDPNGLRNDPEKCLKYLQELHGHIFGHGTIEIADGPLNELTGTIGGTGWSLGLTGGRSYGNPMEARFQGKGMLNGAEWIYYYVGYLVPLWPNGIDQRPALVGTIVRAIPHPSGDPNHPIAPAGVVAQWIAIKQP
jgi:hypothetical protein